jgi:ribosome-associated protein
MARPLKLTAHLTIPAAELAVRAVRSSGPGGQNVNKVASKVELRFALRDSTVLPAAVKLRLRVLARNRIDGDGHLRISSQRTRQQELNLADAEDKLRVLILAAMVPPTKRTPTKPTRSSRRRRVEDKRHRGEVKRTRSERHDD